MAVYIDFLIEQSRSRVMKRLGLPYEEKSADNPLLVYCSITGYCQDGQMAQVEAHTLNYAAVVGILWLVTEEVGMSVLTARDSICLGRRFGAASRHGSLPSGCTDRRSGHGGGTGWCGAGPVHPQPPTFGRFRLGAALQRLARAAQTGTLWLGAALCTVRSL
jgi:hypothetical protein